MSSENQKILLVDDEEDILEFVKYNLLKEGYIVYTALNGKEAIKCALKELPALILLDVMMPEMDGIETCQHLREIAALKNTIITFLTARNEDYSQIAGFDAGADDYITKPVKPKVLVSKIRALLRRGNIELNQAKENSSIQVGDLVIDREKYLVLKNGQEISLPKKEFELIALLASRPGNVFSRDLILNSVWGEDVVVGDRTIDVHIRKLREKIGEDYFKTIKGVGYKFEYSC